MNQTTSPAPSTVSEAVALFHSDWQLFQISLDDRNAGATGGWLVLSWGRSESADQLFASVKVATTAQARRVEVSDRAALAGAAGHLHELARQGGCRVVLFMDGVSAQSRAPAAAPGSDDWAWAKGAIQLSQCVAATPGCRIWFVTATGLLGPQPHGEARPEQCFAWGLGRCHAVESAESWGGLIDIDSRDPAAAGAAVARFMQAGSDEDEVVLQGEGAYVPRMVQLDDRQSVAPSLFDSERLFVVTGGLLGLSFELARWLVARGVRSLLILGRSPLDAERSARLQQLEQGGAAVAYEVVDVGDSTAMRALGQRLHAVSVSIGGLFHLASSWQLDGRSAVAPLRQVTDAQTDEVLHAKASGAIQAAELARRLDARLVVLFSTAAATLGSPGQANYAAANSVLDGVARQLEGPSTRGVSIAWGPIGEVGFGASLHGEELHAVWERIGLLRLSVEQLFSTLDRVIASRATQVTALRLEGAQGLVLPWASARPAMAGLSGEKGIGLALAGLEGKDGEARMAYILDVLQRNVAAILNVSAAEINADASLVDLGVDSLITLEIAFTVDRDFAVNLALDESLLGVGVTLADVARTIERRIGAPAPAAAA